MLRREGVVEELDIVGGGVVLAGDEPGVVGDVDAPFDQPGPNVGVVEDGGGDSGIGLKTAITTTWTELAPTPSGTVVRRS